MVVLLYMYFPCRCAILDCSEQACDKMPGLDQCIQGAHIMCTCKDPSQKIPDFALKFIRQVLKCCDILSFHLHITIHSHRNGLNFSFLNNSKWFPLTHPPVIVSKICICHNIFLNLVSWGSNIVHCSFILHDTVLGTIRGLIFNLHSTWCHSTTLVLGTIINLHSTWCHVSTLLLSTTLTSTLRLLLNCNLFVKYLCVHFSISRIYFLFEYLSLYDWCQDD